MKELLEARKLLDEAEAILELVRVCAITEGPPYADAITQGFREAYKKLGRVREELERAQAMLLAGG